jgi:hypothetical protein
MSTAFAFISLAASILLRDKDRIWFDSDKGISELCSSRKVLRPKRSEGFSSLSGIY